MLIVLALDRRRLVGNGCEVFADDALLPEFAPADDGGRRGTRMVSGSGIVVRPRVWRGLTMPPVSGVGPIAGRLSAMERSVSEWASVRSAARCGARNCHRSRIGWRSRPWYDRQSSASVWRRTGSHHRACVRPSPPRPHASTAVHGACAFVLRRNPGSDRSLPIDALVQKRLIAGLGVPLSLVQVIL